MRKQYLNWMKQNHQEYSNMTELGEACADHFNVMSDDGRTEEEEIIFEVATNFYQE